VLGDLLAVDQRAVAAAGVEQDVAVAARLDGAMRARDREVRQLDGAPLAL